MEHYHGGAHYTHGAAHLTDQVQLLVQKLGRQYLTTKKEPVSFNLSQRNLSDFVLLCFMKTGIKNASVNYFLINVFSI